MRRRLKYRYLGHSKPFGGVMCVPCCAVFCPLYMIEWMLELGGEMIAWLAAE